jgi:hypothetical protein
MTLTSKVLAAAVLAALVAFPVSATPAQDSAPLGNGGSSASSARGAMGDSGSMASSPGRSAQVDDATLQKAAKAYVKVKQIVHQSKQAESGNNGAQADQASAQSAKLAAVRNEGLDPQQYNQVIQMVQNDPQLQQKFAQYVNQNGGDTD